MLYRKWMAVAVLLLFTASAFGQLFNGNLLPGQNDGTDGPNVLPKTINQIQSTAADSDVVRRYVGNAGANGGPLSASAVFNCPGIGKIGDLVFQYGAYTGEFPNGPPDSAGGMLIRGGLKLAPLIKVKPGHTLRYVQVFKETGGAGTTTIDGNPLYPDHTQTGFTPLFFDAPVDGFANLVVPDRIDFETALVCFKNDKPKELFALGVFQWGYEIDVPNKTIKNEYLLLGNFPTGLTVLLSNTFDKEFGATGTRDTGWTLTAGECPDCFEVIPEPATLLLFALGAAPALRLVWRRRENEA